MNNNNNITEQEFIKFYQEQKLGTLSKKTTLGKVISYQNSRNPDGIQLQITTLGVEYLNIKSKVEANRIVKNIQGTIFPVDSLIVEKGNTRVRWFVGRKKVTVYYNTPPAKEPVGYTKRNYDFDVLHHNQCIGVVSGEQKFSKDNDSSTFEISYLGVNEKYRNQGHGTKILTFLTTLFDSSLLNCPVVSLECGSSLPKAGLFYFRKGFRPTPAGMEKLKANIRNLTNREVTKEVALTHFLFNYHSDGFDNVIPMERKKGTPSINLRAKMKFHEIASFVNRFYLKESNTKIIEDLLPIYNNNSDDSIIKVSSVDVWYRFSDQEEANKIAFNITGKHFSFNNEESPSINSGTTHVGCSKSKNVIYACYNESPSNEPNGFYERDYSLIIYKNKEMVGVIEGAHTFPDDQQNSTFFLDCLRIEENFRGQGYGTKALTFLSETLDNLNCSNISLECFSNNPKAGLIYFRKGFRPTSTGMEILKSNISQSTNAKITDEIALTHYLYHYVSKNFDEGIPMTRKMDTPSTNLRANRSFEEVSAFVNDFYHHNSNIRIIEDLLPAYNNNSDSVLIEVSKLNVIYPYEDPINANNIAHAITGKCFPINSGELPTIDTETALVKCILFNKTVTVCYKKLPSKEPKGFYTREYFFKLFSKNSTDMIGSVVAEHRLLNDSNTSTFILSILKIKKKFRNQGFGTKVLTFFTNTLDKLNCRKISLECYSENPKAGFFYYKHGFRPSKKGYEELQEQYSDNQNNPISNQLALAHFLDNSESLYVPMKRKQNTPKANLSSSMTLNEIFGFLANNPPTEETEELSDRFQDD